MNRFTRILTMAGLGLVTGVTMAAGPAMATTSSDQGTAKSGNSVGEQRRWGDRVVDVFRTYRACDRAGEYGEDRGYWDDYDCYRTINRGRGGYVLVVEEDNWGHGWGGRFPSSWGNDWRPYPGGFFPGIRPGGFWRPGGFPVVGRPIGGFPIGGFPIGGRPIGGFPGGFPNGGPQTGNNGPVITPGQGPVIPGGLGNLPPMPKTAS
ncbi:hypothetical protein GCM10010172_08700 [Paractinoplanes ferrugineus]|uniref:Uncharacterized protein n=2 Tax=Paractinoplanes ferrugineus TaxID=113564 RepID=A0A919J9A0_9ACTN|nr:hypothetical protein Afe05nite_72430 [Actinoplanes ferrugineus]